MRLLFYYKMRQKFITKMRQVFYYKMRRLSHTATVQYIYIYIEIYQENDGASEIIFFKFPRHTVFFTSSLRFFVSKNNYV